MAKAGRKPVELDKERFEEMCEFQCTKKEICLEFNITSNTLADWCKRTYGANFSTVFAQKRQKGFQSLRSAQYALALQGNTTMLIWLGRNWLGQTDKPIQEVKTPAKKRLEETAEFKMQYQEVKENLLKQLEKRKAITPIYKDLIEDYMSFWSIKENLKKDVAERGVYITYNNGGGQTGETDNPSIDKMLKVSTKMKEILVQLEIDLDAVGEEDDEL